MTFSTTTDKIELTEMVVVEMTSSNPLISFDKGVFAITEYDKPFKTYEELIDIMISRNIEVSDRDFAKNALSNMSYYTLINGYKNKFLLLCDEEMFVPGTKFEDLYTLHIIDTNLSSILLKYILHIEQSLKSNISYIVSKNYGVYSDFSKENKKDITDYLSPKNYSPSSNRRTNILFQINRCGIETRNNLSLNHYRATKNHVPPWILIGNVPLGLAIQWYTIMKNADKTYVCENLVRSDSVPIEHKKEFLSKALSILKNYRNSMAHGIRTFANITDDELPLLPTHTLAPTLLNKSEYFTGMGKNNLYALVIIICVLLNDQYLATNFYTDLVYLFQEYKEKDIRFCGNTVFNHFGMPDDALERIFEYTANKYLHYET